MPSTAGPRGQPRSTEPGFPETPRWPGSLALGLTALLWAVMVLGRTRLAPPLGLEALATDGALLRAALVQLLLLGLHQRARVRALVRAALAAPARIARSRGWRRLRAAVARALRPALRALGGPIDPARLARSVAVARALVGLLVSHHALSVLGLGPLTEDPAAARDALVELAAGLAILAGALTPVALLTLLLVRVPAASLGNQVLTILVWGLLLLGAGRTHGLDAVALRSPTTSGAWELLYRFACAPSARRVAAVRLLLVVMFWGLCLRAMADHAFSAPWRSGDVLQAVLTNPYWTDHHALFTALRDAAPGAFDVACRLALAVQAGWEALILPLLLWPRARWVAVWQGWAFFAVSLVTLNLGSLPAYELVLWSLAFGPGRGQAAPGTPPPPRRAAPLLRALAVGLGLVLLLYPVDLPRRGCTLPRALNVLLAQQPVNVFNAPDLATAEAHLVLVEEGADGPRVVPYEDVDGGRLGLLRNPFVLYEWSVSWRRALGPPRFEAGAPTPRTLDLARRVAQLDACLQPARDRTYRVLAFERQAVEGSRAGAPTGWSEARLVARWTVHVSELEARRAQEAGPVFRIPPGHWHAGARTERTLRELTLRGLIHRQP